MFENVSFIKSAAVNVDTKTTYAPMFRRSFCIDNDFKNATLSICGLGYVYSYINGKKSYRRPIYSACQRLQKNSLGKQV